MTTMAQTRAGALLATANINESGNDTVTELMTDLAEAVFDGTAQLDEKSAAETFKLKGRDLYAGLSAIQDFVDHVGDTVDTLSFGAKRVSIDEIDNLSDLQKLFKESSESLADLHTALTIAMNQIQFKS